MIATFICGYKYNVENIVRKYDDLERANNTFFSKIHDLTNPRKMSRFLVPNMISLLFSGL